MVAALGSMSGHARLSGVCVLVANIGLVLELLLLLLLLVVVVGIGGEYALVALGAATTM